MPWLVVYLSHFWSEKLNGWANWHWMLCGSWVVSKLDQQWFLWFYLSIACFFSPTVAKTIMSLVGVCSRFRSQANSLYKVTLRAKRWIPPGWTHMPGTKRHVEKQWALQGSWEQGRHVSLGSISKDKQLNLEKSNRCSALGGETSQISPKAFQEHCTVWPEKVRPSLHNSKLEFICWHLVTRMI